MSFLVVSPKINRHVGFEPFNNFDDDEKSNSGQLRCSNTALSLPGISMLEELHSTVNKIFSLNCIDLNRSF